MSIDKVGAKILILGAFCDPEIFMIFVKNPVGNKTHPNRRKCDPPWPQMARFWVLNATHEKMSGKLRYRSGSQSAPKSAKMWPTMAPNGRFLGAKCDPDVFYMNIGGFRGRSPLTGCLFPTLSNKRRIWQYQIEGCFILYEIFVLLCAICAGRRSVMR
jgi:hypothetical protein